MFYADIFLLFSNQNPSRMFSVSEGMTHVSVSLISSSWLPQGSEENILALGAAECSHCMFKYFKWSIKIFLWFLKLFPMSYAWWEIVSFGRHKCFVPYRSCSTWGHTKGISWNKFDPLWHSIFILQDISIITQLHVAYVQENPVNLEENYFNFDAPKACLYLANWCLSLADTEKGKFTVTFRVIPIYTK